MPIIRQSDLAEYVVKETLRQIRNGQVRLKKLGLECDPELKVDFQVTVVIPGGLNAVTRAAASEQTQHQTTGERTTDQTGSGAGGISEETIVTDGQEQAYGRTTRTDIIYES